MNKTVLTIAILISICGLGTHATAIGICPPGIEAGTLNLSKTYIFPFEIRNLNSCQHDLNITFEITPASRYLENYVTFTPSSILINATEKEANFTVELAGQIPAGDHLLVFKPRIDVSGGLEANGTGNIASEGTTLSTSAASIDFTVPAGPSEPGPPSSPSGSGASGGLPSPAPDANATEVPKKEYEQDYGELKIEVPPLVKATNQSAIVTIIIRNLQNTTFNLTMELTSTPPLTISYEKEIGPLSPYQEKSIELELGNFTDTYHLLNIVLSDMEQGKRWNTSFKVYVPKTPRGMIGDDCIEYEPKNFTLQANRLSRIKINLTNKCNVSLHNLEITISSLDYRKSIDEMGQGEKTSIILDVLPQKGVLNHTITFVYNEGKTTGQIRIDAVVPPRSIILRGMALILLPVLMVLLMYLYTKAKRKKKERPEPQTSGVSKIVERRIEWLKDEISNTERAITELSEKKAALESSIAEKKRLIRDGELTEEQITISLKNVKASIEEKNRILRNLKKETELLKKEEEKRLKVEIKKGQLEKSIWDEEKAIGTLTQRKETARKEDEEKLRKYLKHLKQSVENNKNALESLREDEESLRKRTEKKRKYEEDMEQLKQSIEDNIQTMESLKKNEEALHLRILRNRETLRIHQKKLDLLNRINSIEKLKEKKKDIEDVLLALDRLYSDKIIGKEIYESRKMVRMELDDVDKRISSKLKERDEIKKEAERFLGKKKEKLKKSQKSAA